MMESHGKQLPADNVTKVADGVVVARINEAYAEGRRDAAPPSDAAPPPLDELNAIGSVLGSVVSAHKAHIGLSGDCYTPQIRAASADAACNALKSLREYFAAHPEDAPEPTFSGAMIRLHEAVQEKNVPVPVNSWDLALILNELVERMPHPEDAPPREGQRSLDVGPDP